MPAADCATYARNKPAGEDLREPLVACGLGRIYNKEAMLKFLLGKDHQFKYNGKQETEVPGTPAAARNSARRRVAWRPAGGRLLKIVPARGVGRAGGIRPLEEP